MNTNDRLETALAALIEAQAMLSTNVAVLQQTQAGHIQDMSAIRQEFADIKTILAHHQQLLHDLPDAVRDRIGFQSP